jgi:hypothetical protein
MATVRSVELIERRAGDTHLRLVLLDGLTPADLDYVLGLGCNMTEELYVVGSCRKGTTSSIRKRDVEDLVDLGTYKVVVIKNSELLSGFLSPQKKSRPGIEALALYLASEENVHMHDLWLREVERTVEDHVDPIDTQPLLEEHAPEPVTFGDGVMDLPAVRARRGEKALTGIKDDDIDCVVEEFFDHHTEGEATIWLTEEKVQWR